MLPRSQCEHSTTWMRHRPHKKSRPTGRSSIDGPRKGRSTTDEARAARETTFRIGPLLASTCGARRWRTSHGEAIVAPFLLRRLHDSRFRDHSPGAPNNSPEPLLSLHRMTCPPRRSYVAGDARRRGQGCSRQQQLVRGIQNRRSSAYPSHPRSIRIPRAYSTSANSRACRSAVTPRCH
jgi:hypothetical protein